METVITDRLEIIKLNRDRLQKLLTGLVAVETDLGLAPSGKELDEETQTAMEMLYNRALQDTDVSNRWSSSWQIILKQENKIIGSVNFKNKPNEKGQVEIGYGIFEDFQNKGYMTEAVVGLCKWAFRQEGIKSVIAETYSDNLASQKVLEKTGMTTYAQDDKSIWWEIKSL